MYVTMMLPITLEHLQNYAEEQKVSCHMYNYIISRVITPCTVKAEVEISPLQVWKLHSTPLPP